jgi:hypothetical protein
MVKLLGFHINQELHWREQGAAAVGKGQGWLVQLGRLARVSKGITMPLICRFYISTALLRILYSVDVFLAPARHNLGATLKKDNRAIVGKIATIQRKAAIMITGTMASTPTDILNAHANLLPIPLLIDKILHHTALHFATMLSTHPLHEAVKNASKRHVKRHSTPLHYIMNNYAGLKPD